MTRPGVNRKHSRMKLNRKPGQCRVASWSRVFGDPPEVEQSRRGAFLFLPRGRDRRERRAAVGRQPAFGGRKPGALNAG